MTSAARLLDCVALLRDFPERGVSRGDVGAVVEVYGDEAYEVEFVNPDGQTLALFPVSREDCLPLHLRQGEPALTGIVDGTLWYWYDPIEDMLDVRVASKRSATTRPEATADGFTLLRDTATGAAVGMVVRGFWRRFGNGAVRPAGADLESRVKGVTGPRLAA